MPRLKKAFTYSLFLISMFLFQGCDTRGANDPFAYAPPSPYSVWAPPERALRRLKKSTSNLARTIEDYELFSEETPLSLAEVIDIALYHNPATKESWADARLAAAEYGQSLQNDFILADINGDFTRSRSAEFTSSDREIIYETQYGLELELSYLLFDFGQTRITSESALQALYQADWKYNSQVQQTIQTLMTSYYNYLYQKKLLASFEQDTINAKVTLDATEEKFRNGLADVSDVIQAKTTYFQKELTQITQKQEVEATYALLLAEIGLPANASLFFQEYPEKVKTVSLETLDDLILQANANRPDLLAAEAGVKSNLAALKAAKLERYPTFTGTFDIGRRYFQQGLTDTYDFKAMVGVKMPLFQGFFISNQIKAAQANLELSYAELEAVKLTMIQEVATYRSAAVNAREALNYAKHYVEAAEIDYDVNLKRYRVGTGTIVDVISALTAVSDARAQLAQTENTWYTSLADLAYAVGVLFPPRDKRFPTYPLIEKENNGSSTL